MSGFLSKSRQKLDHTSKLPFTGGEFKLLANVISTEKTVLTSHVRAGIDVKRASTALEEWTASEGPDLSVSPVHWESVIVQGSNLTSLPGHRRESRKATR